LRNITLISSCSVIFGANSNRLCFMQSAAFSCLPIADCIISVTTNKTSGKHTVL
jgi:hypothetical protein